MPVRTVLIASLLCTAIGCENRPRHDNAGVSLSDTGPGTGSNENTNVYRFVGVGQSLSDARHAMTQERWGMALVAARALLRQEPTHVEAQKIADKASFEAMNQMHFDVFQRSVTAKDMLAAGTHYRQIASESVYYERARPEYEKVRDQWGQARENETRTLAAKGRCRDAHHTAKLAGDAFPESRTRLDTLADNCRPTAGQEADTETAAAASSPPIASLLPVAHQTQPVAEPPRPAPSLPVPTPVAVVPQPIAVAPRPVGPRMIPGFELEKLRTAGSQKPSLTAGARMIAHRDGVKQIAAAVSFCVSTEGVPEHVELVKHTEYNDLDQKIVGDVSGWRFKPYVGTEGPLPVCTRLIFMWQIE